MNNNYYLSNNFGWMAGLMSCCTMLALSIAYVFFVTWIIQWLWNAIVVVKFAAPELTFWETFGLCVMLRLIFPSWSFNNKKNS